jgi:hypothetical protein
VLHPLTFILECASVVVLKALLLLQEFVVLVVLIASNVKATPVYLVPQDSILIHPVAALHQANFSTKMVHWFNAILTV